MAQRSRAIEASRVPLSPNRALRLALIATLIGGLLVLGFLILAAVSIEVWEVTSSVSFCTNACHDVHPEEAVAFQESYHAEVKCTECHSGRVSTFEALALKTSHVRHLVGVLLNTYERPLESASMRPASESCERCHWPSAFHDSTAREIVRFLPDESNTEKRTYLLLKTGAGALEPGGGSGIHWHIANPLEYIATDEGKQEIPWVRATLPDGQVVEYTDQQNPLSPEEIDRAEKQVMDCVDCHNRSGHPFPSPEELVDAALADGRLSPDLPFAKQEMMALLTASYASQAEALAAAASFPARYQQAHPEAASDHAAEVEQATGLAQELIVRLVFEEPGVTWQSFSDNIGHKDTAGCFRCHDGQHISSDGEIIRLNCNLCHSIPLTVDGGDEPPSMPLVALEEPASHLEANFIRDHGTQAIEPCVECHGDVQYGNDDSSFCANSACHGQAWPTVDLAMGFSHPTPLEGKHAEALCSDCHDGSQAIGTECGACHEPPEQPHYGNDCQACHTPGGFKLAIDTGFVHPTALVGQHASLDCASCHEGDASPEATCASCHEPPEGHSVGACDTCHTAVGWIESARLAEVEGPAIPHAVTPGDGCAVCHDPAGPNWPAPPDHAGMNGEQCVVCHARGELTLATFDPGQIGHALEGQHATVACAECHTIFAGISGECFACHGDDEHGSQLGQDCAQCHTPDGWEGASVDHSLTAFPLTGAHRGADCSQCHNGSSFAGTPQACAACHEAPGFHSGSWGTNCAQCHTTKGWTPAGYDGPHTFPLNHGGRGSTACETCHPDSLTAYTCYNCHKPATIERRHQGEGVRNIDNCVRCHPRGRAEGGD